MNTGDRIKQRRMELGLTQEELGKRIGVQKSAIAKYENGRVVNLKRSVIAKLADVLDCAPSFLMCLDDDKSDQAVPDPKSEQLQALLATMSGEEKEELLNYIKYLLSKRDK